MNNTKMSRDGGTLMKTTLNIKIKNIKAEDQEYYRLSEYSKTDVSIQKVRIIHSLFNGVIGQGYCRSYGQVYTEGGFVKKYFKAVGDKVSEEVMMRFYRQALEDSEINIDGKSEEVVSISVSNSDKELVSAIQGLSKFLKKVLKNEDVELDIYLKREIYTDSDLKTDEEIYDDKLIKHFILNMPELTNKDLKTHYYNVDYDPTKGDAVDKVQKSIAKAFNVYKAYIEQEIKRGLVDGYSLRVGENLAKDSGKGDKEYRKGLIRLKNCFWVDVYQ